MEANARPHPDRVDHLTDASRETASGLETLRATIAAVQAQLTAIGGHLAESQAAQARTAAGLEHVRHEIARLEPIERRISQLRGEVTEHLAAEQANVQQLAAELRHRIDADSERLSREIAPLAGRIRVLEGLPERLVAIERGHGEIAGAFNKLEAGIEAVAAERTAIAEVVRQGEVRLSARIDALDVALDDLRPAMEHWRERIDAQTEAVRQAQAVAEEMRAEVLLLQRAQHEVAEAERLWEGRVDALLQDHWAKSDEAWQTFLTQRGHDRGQLATENAARDARLDALADELQGVDATVRALPKHIEQQSEAQVELVLELRRQLHAVVDGWSEAVSELARVIESGLPTEERPSVIDERRRALRRAVRARRDDHED